MSVIRKSLWKKPTKTTLKMADIKELQDLNEQLQKKLMDMELRMNQIQIFGGTTALNCVPTPEKFSFIPNEWPKWKTNYERYRSVAGITNISAEAQANSLLLHMGEAVNEILDNHPPTAIQLATYEGLIAFFNDKFMKQVNVIFERAQFNKRTQREGETAQEFITAVTNLSKTCNYGQMTDELVRDKLVAGILDAKLSETLQLDKNLTLQSAKSKILQNERVKLENKTIRDQTGDINRVHREKYQPKKQSNLKDSPKHPQCGRCGSKPSHTLRECPAIKEKCRKCDIKGHYAKMCKTGHKKHVARVVDTSSSDSEVGQIICEVSDGKNTQWNISLALSSGEHINCKIDTGADVSIFSKQNYDKLSEKPRLKHTRTKLKGPGNTNLPVIGKINLPVCWKGDIRLLKMFVIENKDNLLGRPAIENLNVLKFVDEITNDKMSLNKIMSDYPELFKGFGKLKNYEHDIKLDPDAQPYSICTPRRIPLPLLQSVEKELKYMVEQDIIEEVSPNNPTPWCAPMVCVPKKGGKIRICADFTELNKHVQREKIILPTVDATIAQIKNAKVFSKLDCASSFWQLSLTDPSKNYTAFLTPFGRYIYKRVPFGITSAPEIYQQAMNRLFHGQKGVLVHMDDITIFADSEKHHNEILKKVLEILKENSLTLNKDKCQIGISEIKLLGHIVGKSGLRIDDNNIKAIIDFKPPENVSQVRQFLGMINHLTKFLGNAAEHTRPLRELLKQNVVFTFNQQHLDCFNKLKTLVTTAPVLKMYNVSAKTRILADSSSYGIGGCLEQLQSDGRWAPVIYCSKSLSETQQRYAQIEKEAYAVTWVCERLEEYLLGKSFTIQTDHLPLLSILKKKPINDLTVRLQRFRLRLTRFVYEMEHVPGKSFYIPDTLSRRPLPEGDKDKDVLEEEVTLHINVINKQLLEDDLNTSRKRITEAQKKELTKLGDYVEKGWPDKKKVTGECQKYFKYKEDITFYEDTLYYKDIIIIPPSLYKETLKNIHIGHQGINSCKSRAKNAVWWPHMNNFIEEKISNCLECLKNKNQETDPMTIRNLPVLPFEHVATDLFVYKNITYMVVQDVYSKYPEVIVLSKTKSEHVIEKLKEVFSRFGIPKILYSDGGPQFDSYIFRDFAKSYDFKHIISSPKFPQSNGCSERAVQLVKNLIKKCEDFNLGLLAYRNTPLPCGNTPSELLMGRILRELLPINETKLKPKLPDHEQIIVKQKEEQKRSKENYDRRHASKELPKLESGDFVWVRDMKRTGYITQTACAPSSFFVETEEGTLRRNRKFLTKLPENKDKNAPPKALDEEDKDKEQKKKRVRKETDNTLRRSERIAKRKGDVGCQ